MSNWKAGSALAVALVLARAPVACGEPQAGQMLDASNADEAKALLPPEIYKHYKSGDYRNRIVDFPDASVDWDDSFKAGTKRNREHIVLDEKKTLIDRATGKRPDYLEGLPFPDVRAGDPDAGYRVLWNLVYAYYSGGNSRNYTELNWVSRRGRERSAIQDVFFLYYEGQPRQYSPVKNEQNLLFQFLAATLTPADIQGTAALGYRFKDPAKRDLSWAYVPALRRVRAVSPANRSDGFLGSDQSQDDGFFFDGKPEDFTWKVVGEREGYRLVDPGSIAGKTQNRALPGGGWRTTCPKNQKTVGYEASDWTGAPWAPVDAALAKRKFWVVEGIPKDKYYLYGRLELWIDGVSWQGAWNRKFSWQGDLLNIYQVMGYATAPYNDKERWWGATMQLQLSENVKGDRATASGMDAPGEDPANDRRIPLDPGFFDYGTLNRFGK